MATSGAELAQQELVEEFEMFDNWMDRYQYIIDMGKQLPDFPEERRTEEYKIQAANPTCGCAMNRQATNWCSRYIGCCHRIRANCRVAAYLQ